jgi:hypothetical protein
VAEGDLAHVAEQHVEREPDDPVDDRGGVALHLEALLGEREHEHEPGHRQQDEGAGRHPRCDGGREALRP